MSSAEVVLAVENLSQSVAALLGNLAAFNTAYANTLINTIEFIKADVNGLSFTAAEKSQIITVLNQAESIISGARAAGTITIEQINTILELLQLVVLKVNTFSFLT